MTNVLSPVRADVAVKKTAEAPQTYILQHIKTLPQVSKWKKWCLLLLASSNFLTGTIKAEAE